MGDFKDIEQQLRQRMKELEERVDEIEDELGAEGDDDFDEMATESSNDEVLSRTGVAADNEISNILEALDRIKSGDYGKCKSCRADIPMARLEAVPYTAYCVKCAETHGE